MPRRDDVSSVVVGRDSEDSVTGDSLLDEIGFALVDCHGSEYAFAVWSQTYVFTGRW